MTNPIRHDVFGSALQIVPSTVLARLAITTLRLFISPRQLTVILGGGDREGGGGRGGGWGGMGMGGGGGEGAARRAGRGGTSATTHDAGAENACGCAMWPIVGTNTQVHRSACSGLSLRGVRRASRT